MSPNKHLRTVSINRPSLSGAEILSQVQQPASPQEQTLWHVLEVHSNIRSPLSLARYMCGREKQELLLHLFVASADIFGITGISRGEDSYEDG